MESYKNAANEAEKMILKFIEDRMVELTIDEKLLSKIIKVQETDINDYLNGRKTIPLNIFLEVLGALKIRPYFVPAEADQTKMNRMFFN